MYRSKSVLYVGLILSPKNIVVIMEDRPQCWGVGRGKGRVIFPFNGKPPCPCG